MNIGQENLAKLMAKLGQLESRLETQQDEITRLSYFKTHTDPKQISLENIEANLQTRRNSIISARKESIVSAKVEEKGLINSLRKHFLEWMLVSTWTGPGIIIRVKSIIRKIYWTILFLLCMAATIYVLVLTVNAYMQYGEVTSISVNYDEPTEFPTVSKISLQMRIIIT